MWCHAWLSCMLWCDQQQSHVSCTCCQSWLALASPPVTMASIASTSPGPDAHAHAIRCCLRTIHVHRVLHLLQIRGMHTILRDANTAKSDFVFYADRLNRLIVEAGLGLLPFAEKTVMTPTGAAATAASWHDASGQQDFRCSGEVKRCCCTRASQAAGCCTIHHASCCAVQRRAVLC